MKKSELKEIIEEVLSESNLMLSRRQHDNLMDKKPKLLKQLFDTYKTKWSLRGVTFFNISQHDIHATKAYISEEIADTITEEDKQQKAIDIRRKQGAKLLKFLESFKKELDKVYGDDEWTAAKETHLVDMTEYVLAKLLDGYGNIEIVIN